MRLHHLQVTAFGPFADSVSVDFDALSQAGLFLLTGATGAGKTSVLDAVCFALYGDVPGDRATARRLRSDQAEPGVTPRVSLECTLAGRRFQITRSPAWQRPKRRGHGTTAQQASVTVLERIAGSWQPLTSRLDEAGHLITGLVGMTLTQFTQVALLPQGRFQGFLRARSEDRHRLLQQLFRTNRFEQIEQWLRDHRLTLVGRSDTAASAVSDLVSRLGEVVLPGQSAPDSPELLHSWSQERLVELHRASADATTAEARARDLAQTSARDLDQARDLARRQLTHVEAEQRLTGLLSMTAEIESHQAELAAARRAAALRPLLQLVEEATIDHDLAAASCAKARAAVSSWAPPAGQLAEIAHAWRDTLARASSWAPRSLRLSDLQSEAAAAAVAAERLAAELGALDETVATLPGQLQHLNDLLATTEQIAALRAGLKAIDDAERLSADLAQARSEQQAVRDTALGLKDQWLTLREERITGMAAELAGSLAVGGCCPVCGSADHPHLATPRPDAPDAAAERRARKLVDDAEAQLAAHDAAVRDLESRVAVAQAAQGVRSAEALREELSGALIRADELRYGLASPPVGARLADLADVDPDTEPDAALLARLTAHLQESDARAAQLRTELAAATATDRSRQSEITALRQELTGLLDGSGADDLSTLVELAQGRIELLSAALGADQARSRAEAVLQRLLGQAAQAAIDAEFPTVQAASAAARDDDEIAALEGLLTDHRASLAAARAQLADTELVAAAAQPAPDLERLTAAVTEADAQHAAARASVQVAQARVERAIVLIDDLHERLTAWAPLRAQLEVATRLSSFVEGKSLDNNLRMRLSAYVLAHRLAQVVAAANHRLVSMSDRRYTLEHTGRRGAGETRGGLSLLVRDDWSGEARDPATLSGGETFVVSLALALGLADVVIDEVGGATLDTLFVDEGFGTLDAETLDDVMDTLDSLRDGGRVVAVVSHVAELRDRIPTQLRVMKGRRGSTVAVSQSSG